MKQLKVLGGFLAFICIACSHDGYKLQVEVDKSFTDEVAYLYNTNAQGRHLDLLDSAKIKNGVAVFEGEVVHPRILQVSVGEDFASLFVENSDIKVKLAQGKRPEISGSAEQAILTKFEQGYEQAINDFYALQKEYDALSANKETDKKVELEEKLAAIDTRIEDLLKNTIENNRNSYAAVYLALRSSYFLTGDDSDALGEIISQFTQPILESPYGEQLIKLHAQMTKLDLGKIAPDFTLQTPDKRELTLSAVKAKLILVDFWASWCPPCRRENPYLVELYAKYHAKGLEIVGVSLDKDAEKWQKAIKDDKLSWLHGSDLKMWQSPVAKQYGVKAIPTNFLLDSEGKILAKALFGEDLEDFVKEFLTKK